MPHSEYLKTCHRCDGSGRVTCSSCRGWGTTSESYTDSNGRSQRRSVTCSHCGGSGKTICGTCDGYTILKHFTVLKCKFMNHPEDFYFGRGLLSKSRMKKASGHFIFRDEGLYVEPLPDGIPDASIIQTSISMLDKHKGKFTNGMRILQQRHSVLMIPMSIISYDYKSTRNNHFLIYGTDNQIKFNDYPIKCKICPIC